MSDHDHFDSSSQPGKYSSIRVLIFELVQIKIVLGRN